MIIHFIDYNNPFFDEQFFNEQFQINETGNADEIILDASSLSIDQPKPKRGMNKVYDLHQRFENFFEASDYLKSAWIRSTKIITNVKT